MFVRVTWSQLAPRGTVEEATKFFKDRVLPSLKAQSGFLGAAALGNAETREGATVTYWQSVEAMAASESMATAGRAEVAQASNVMIKDIERFEMLLQDRVAPVKAGTFVRLNDLPASRTKIDATIKFLRENVQTLRSLDGYRAMLVLANHETGRMLIASVWESAAKREASDAAIGGLRRQAFEIAGAQAGAARVSLLEALFAEVSQAAQESTTQKAGVA